MPKQPLFFVLFTCILSSGSIVAQSVDESKSLPRATLLGTPVARTPMSQSSECESHKEPQV